MAFVTSRRRKWRAVCGLCLCRPRAALPLTARVVIGSRRRGVIPSLLALFDLLSCLTEAWWVDVADKGRQRTPRCTKRIERGIAWMGTEDKGGGLLLLYPRRLSEPSSIVRGYPSTLQA